MKEKLHLQMFNKITSTILLTKIHPFCDGNGRTCKIPFPKDCIIRKKI